MAATARVPAGGKSLNPRQHVGNLRRRSPAPGEHHGHQPAERGAGERSRLRAGDELGGQQHQIRRVRDDRGDARPEQGAPGRVRSPGAVRPDPAPGNLAAPAIPCRVAPHGGPDRGECGIGGQVLAGSVCSGVGAYLSVRYLVRYFQTRTLTPFAIYCTVAGLACLAYLTLR